MTISRVRALSLALVALAGCASPNDEGTSADEGPVTASGKTFGEHLSNDDPDRDADPAVMSPEDTVTAPATKTELIRRFAPHLNLHPSDRARPANVDWYLARVSMRFHHAHCPDHEVLPLGRVTQASLVAQSHADNRSLCRHDDAKVVTSKASEGFFLEVADHATYAGAPRTEWKDYVVWRPRTTGNLVDIEYWAFYPFNDNVAMFNHESDWEHVRVTIDPTANGGRGKPMEVKFSQHHGGEILKPGDPKLTLDEGTHPVSYVASGTHANYPTPGTFDIPGTGGVAKDRAAPAASPGEVWRTEDDLVLVGTRSAPQNGQVFIAFWGRWGQLGDLPETDGVTRHFP